MNDQSIESARFLGMFYEPEIWTVRKDYIYAAIAAIKNGIEYAQMCLAEHDSALGRTTLKNRNWAETMERDIRQMQQALDCFQGPNADLTGNQKPGKEVEL
jgi:hypothetical protein